MKKTSNPSISIEKLQTDYLEKISANHNSSVGQVVICRLTQRNIAVLAKSVRRECMAENLKSFDFTLDDEDMAAIKSIDTNTSIFFSHQDPAMVEQLHQWIAERNI